MKIINDETLDWTSKFFMLLNSTSGSALTTIQVYSDDLNMDGFIQAIEDLYYNYGRASKFREALLHQLFEVEPIDPRKPETLQKTNALIKRILRSFPGSDQNGDFLMSYLLSNINMTESARKEYRSWLTATDKQRGLPSFTRWLTITHEQSTDILFAPMPTKSARSSRAPVLFEATDVPLLDDKFVAMANQDDQMSNHCVLCFDEKHKFSDCTVFMTSLDPDQRKLALLRHIGCYICTEMGHTALKCYSKRSCQICQSSKHHETICKAEDDSWQAVLNTTSQN